MKSTETNEGNGKKERNNKRRERGRKTENATKSESVAINFLIAKKKMNLSAHRTHAHKRTEMQKICPCVCAILYEKPSHK